MLPWLYQWERLRNRDFHINNRTVGVFPDQNGIEFQPCGSRSIVLEKYSVVKTIQLEYNTCRVNREVNLGCATTLYFEPTFV